MIENGRILCINPRCRRTASAEKYPDTNAIVCGKCWRSLPETIRTRHKRLEHRERRLLRRVEQRIAQGTISGALVLKIGNAIEARINESWNRVRKYFQEPEGPAGLEGFLKEVGLST